MSLEVSQRFWYVFFLAFYGLASSAIAYKNAEEFIIFLYFPPKPSHWSFQDYNIVLQKEII